MANHGNGLAYYFFFDVAGATFSARLDHDIHTLETNDPVP